jgi:integrase
MAAKFKRLTARSIAAAKKPGRYSDGGNLYLHVTASGARSWVFLYKFAGRQREMGLGSLAVIGLPEARRKALEARAALVQGQDPLALKRAARARLSAKTFGECALEVIASKKSEWRNAKHRAQWRYTLETLAAPLWGMPVAEVALEHVLGVLKPIWQDKAETASRLRGRIEAVLDYAAVHGWRAGENPARWRGHLSHLLARRQKLSRGHHAAMAYAGVPGFLAELRQQESMAGLALEFLILTATRAGEAAGTRWAEIDMAAKVWAIPPARMKAGKEHRVPLCGQALAILERLAEARTGEFVFPGQHGRHIAVAALWKACKRLNRNVTVHGFRSAFRDWCGDATSFPREIAEGALAHASGDATELAYRRSDALEKRRELMSAWVNFLAGAQADVVPLRAANARKE